MAEETTTEVADSGSSEASETPVTFANLSSIELQPASEGLQEEPEKALSDTPPDTADTADEDDEEIVEDDEDTDEGVPPEDDSANADEKPSNVNKFVWKDYRKLKTNDEKVLGPLRDPDATPELKFQAIADYMPNAGDEIAQAAAQYSVDAFPDKWLAHILGDEKATVESVKASLNGAEAAPARAGTTETTSKFKSLADTPEAQKYVDYLDTQYGKDAWRNPENDNDLSVDDEDSVRVFRANLAIEESRKADFDAMQSRLNELEPAVQNIEEGQKTEVENLIESTYQTKADAYEQHITEYAVPAGLKAEGLLPEAGDSEEVKFFKERMAAKFQPIADGYPSPFGDFMQTGFSGKEKYDAIRARVTKYVRESAKLEVAAKREKDPAKAAALSAKAKTLDGHAEDERASARIIGKKAVKEFAAAEAAPYKKLLERIAILEGQTKNRLRTEVVGGVATGTATENNKRTFDTIRSIEL